MLNIDTARPPGSAPGIPADTSTPQPQDGIFNQTFEAEYEKTLVPAESQTATPPPPEKKEAGKSEEDSSLSAISLLIWTQPLWQTLPGSAGEQLPGKETTSPPSLPAVPALVAATGSPIAEQATPLDYVVAAANQPVANGSLPVEPSAADSLLLEATVSIVHATDNPKPAESSQPETSLQKQADPAGPNPSVPLASADTAASNGDAKEQQSQGSKHANPEINISLRPAEPEEEQRAVRVMYKPVPETQLPSDPRGPASSHDTGQILPAGSPKMTETPNVPQSQVWNQIEESSVISQLVSKARGFHWEKNSEIVISLKPESLGRISLRASIIDQTVVATIVTESNKVKNLIELEMPVLHHALQENGMPVKVAVVQGSDLSFSSTAGNGQSHLNQNPSFQKSNDSPNLWAPQLGDRNDVGLTESPEVVDSRYRSRSIHLIA